MFSVKPNFICIFKVGDNIIYNLQILTVLYKQYESSDEPTKRLLVKPIVVIITGIIEALLYDFLIRIKANIYEGVVNLGRDVINAIRSKEFDQLEHYIAQARKHDLFDQSATNFYEALDELRKKRNRIHIQNLKNYKPENEYAAFAEADKVRAEKILEKIVETLSRKYPRPDYLHAVNDFNFPWTQHYPPTSSEELTLDEAIDLGLI